MTEGHQLSQESEIPRVPWSASSEGVKLALLLLGCRAFPFSVQKNVSQGSNSSAGEFGDLEVQDKEWYKGGCVCVRVCARARTCPPHMYAHTPTHICLT